MCTFVGLTFESEGRFRWHSCIRPSDNLCGLTRKLTVHTPRELLTAAAIEAMAAQHKVHSLNPNAVRSAKSLGDAVGLTQLGVHLVTVMPGHDSTEYHRHLYEEEFVYLLSGRGTAQINGQTFEVAAGDFLGFSRNGVAHGLSNTGTEPMVCLVAGQRLEQDVCDYPHQNKRLYINGAQEDMVDTRHINTQD